MKIVVVISANAEWRAVKELYPDLQIQQSPFGEFADLTFDLRPVTLFHGGWGKISAAASAQYTIDRFKPDLLINLGTCGGFAGRIDAGAIILVERTLIYDIVEQMGDAAEALEYYATDIAESREWKIENDSVVRGLLVSADRDILAEDIPVLIQKYNAVAADWESGAIAWVAKKNHTRLLILRGVSDLVGEEDSEAYGNIDLFRARAKTMMKKLFDALLEYLRF